MPCQTRQEGRRGEVGVGVSVRKVTELTPGGRPAPGCRTIFLTHPR